jgi:hypothetical protein
MGMLRVSVLLLLLSACAAVLGQPVQRQVLIDFYDPRDLVLNRPEGEPLVTGVVPVWMISIFHNGDFDAFDLGRLADPALRDFANEGSVDRLREKLAEIDPDAILRHVVAFTSGVFDATNWLLALGRPWPNVDPAKHRYVSFLVKIAPTDDGFWGNDNPRQFELFDAHGNFTGPIVFDVFGDDLLDAGTRENREENLLMLDRTLDEVDLEAGVATAEPITRHPGLNGSLGNPDAQPQRVLGSTFLWSDPNSPRTVAHLHYDREMADFTRPGHKLFTVKITSGLHEGYSGAWYDPRRDGEGFLFDVFQIDGKQHLSVFWFTYAPDGSGEQVFLAGVAPIPFVSGWIDLYRTEGGQFSSLSNPETVQREPWGRIFVSFDGRQCESATIDPIEPLDPAWPVSTDPAERMRLERMAPLSQAAQRMCARSVSAMYNF